MRERLTKQGMEKNDCPTTMDVSQANPKVEKYETGNPDSWAETPDMSRPWEQENSAGREETGHPKMKAKANTYASMVREAKELEAKALRCLKMAETILPEATVDVIEKQAVDFMTMSSNSVNSTLRRMREFDEQISEARVAKIVDAVMEVMAEEKVEASKEEEKKVEEVEEKVEASKEEKKEEEEVEEKCASEEDEDTKIATIVEAVLEVLAEEEIVESSKEEEKKEEEKIEASKEEEKKEEEIVESSKEEEKKEEEIVESSKEEEKKEEEVEEKVEASKEEKKEEESEKEEEEEEATTASEEISFDELGDVMASEEDEKLLSQIFTAEETPKEEVKEAKIKTLKNVTASKGENEIDKLSSLWRKDY